MKNVKTTNLLPAGYLKTGSWKENKVPGIVVFSQ